MGKKKFGLADGCEEVWFGLWARRSLVWLIGEKKFGRLMGEKSLVWLMSEKKFGLADGREEVWFG